MKFNGLTDLGKAYMAKCMSKGIPIKFAKVKIGNGMLRDGQDPSSFKEVLSLKKEIFMSEKKQIDDAFQFLVVIDNKDLKEGYYPREVGVYVEDEGVEKLYWYINDGIECQYLPPESKGPTKHKFWETIMVTNLETLIVNWDPKGLYVDKAYVDPRFELSLSATMKFVIPKKSSPRLDRKVYFDTEGKGKNSLSDFKFDGYYTKNEIKSKENARDKELQQLNSKLNDNGAGLNKRIDAEESSRKSEVTRVEKKFDGATKSLSDRVTAEEVLADRNLSQIISFTLKKKSSPDLDRVNVKEDYFRESKSTIQTMNLLIEKVEELLKIQNRNISKVFAFRLENQANPKLNITCRKDLTWAQVK